MENSNIDALNAQLAEVSKQKAAIERAIADERRKSRAGAIKQIHAVMAEYGISAKDLDVKRSANRGRTVTAQYAGPNGETWTGRGRVPKWMEGDDREKYRITKNSAE